MTRPRTAARRPSRRAAVTVTLGVAIGALVGVTVTGAWPSPDRAAAPVAESQVVEVSVHDCGAGWTGQEAGLQRLAFHNGYRSAGEAQIVAVDSGRVLLEVEPLGPGTTVPRPVSLAAGTYRVRCLMDDADAVEGPAVTLTGPGRADNPGVRPVGYAALIPATLRYEHYVRRHLPGVLAGVAALRADLAAGRLVDARQHWLRAHLRYERLGAAYGAFGPLDAAVNGLPDGLPRGVRDPGWTGFHQLEWLLWHGATAARLTAPARRLSADLEHLRRRFRTAQLDPLELTLRAHEISENALQRELTGQTEFGSHSALATVSANLDGTRVALRFLRPFIAARGLHWRRVSEQLDRADRLVLRQRRPDGTWRDLRALPQRERARIDATIGRLCEVLAPVAVALEPRRTE
jgi:iron uptake system component EfeO